MTEGVFDSHAHYDDKRFDADRDEILSGLPEKGITGVMNAAIDLKSAKKGMELAERYGFVFASAGIHPHEAKNAPPDLEAQLDKLLRRPEVKAVGETGLDYHYDFSPRETQKKIFEAQLKIALEHDMPVIIHDREAHSDTLILLKKYRPKGVVHCYSGSVEMAKELLALGFYIGFTGVVTFKNARRTAESVSEVPLDRILIETDCPYMAPEPFRGYRCDSSMLKMTAETISGIKNIPINQLINATFKNACEIYNI